MIHMLAFLIASFDLE